MAGAKNPAPQGAAALKVGDRLFHATIWRAPDGSNVVPARVQIQVGTVREANAQKVKIAQGFAHTWWDREAISTLRVWHMTQEEALVTLRADLRKDAQGAQEALLRVLHGMALAEVRRPDEEPSPLRDAVRRLAGAEEQIIALEQEREQLRSKLSHCESEVAALRAGIGASK